MKVKTITCLVTLGPMTAVPQCVPAWEVAVLEEKFGGRLEQVKDGEMLFGEDLMDAGYEFSRLQDAYGSDPETKVAHVSNAYGRGQAGFDALEKAMKKAIVKTKNVKEDKVEKPQKAEKPEPTPKKENVSDDPFEG